MNDIEHILPCRNEVGEGALWSVDEQVLYWIDIPGKCFFRFDPVSDTYQTMNIGVQIGVLAERTSGGLIIATEKGIAAWDTTTHELQYLAQPFDDPRIRFNDGAVDCAGRFWVGSMADDRASLPEGGTLYRFDPDGSIHEMIQHVGCSNGIGWNPENTLMYYADSDAHKIYCYDFDLTSGTIANQRVLNDNTGEVSVPDGLTVDSEGYIWCAYWDGAKIVRYAPTGEVERTIAIPALRPTSCAFAGPNLTDLYITSASNFAGPVKEQYPLSGDLFRLKTDVRGQVKYKFAG